MGLSIEGANMTVGKRFRQRLRCVTHESRALAAVNDEGRRFYGPQFGSWQFEVADNRRVVDEGVRHRLKRRPEGRVPQLDNDLFRNPDQLSLEQLDRLATAVRRHK